jgi:hypothetical protein
MTWPQPYLAFCLSVSLLIWANAGSAQPNATADAATLDARAAELEQALVDVQRPTRMYFASWLSALSALAVGQGVIGLVLDDEARRASMFLGAGLSVAGVGLMLITPFPARHGAGELRGMPSSTLADKRAQVARGEELLEGEADSAWFQRAWFQHVLVTALGAGVGVFLGLLHPDRVWDVALPSALGTFATAELQILTRPGAAIGHWDRYRARVPEVAAAPWIAPHTLGLGVHARF